MNAAVALDQRKDRVFVAAAAAMRLLHRLAADVGHVRLDHLSLTAQRVRIDRRLHNFADAVGEEPSGFHAAIEGPLDLASRNAFLAAADKLDCLQPQMQREMAVLENAADSHGEGLTAGIAFAESGAAALAVQSANPLAIHVPAMGANRPFRPQVSLDIGESRIPRCENVQRSKSGGPWEISYGRNTIPS
jgi:hypothetical protein